MSVSRVVPGGRTMYGVMALLPENRRRRHRKLEEANRRISEDRRRSCAYIGLGSASSNGMKHVIACK